MTEFVPPENPLSTNQDAGNVYAAPETQIVTTWKIACSGDEASGSGHPRIWIAISPISGFADCGYCDKRSVIDRANASEDH